MDFMVKIHAMMHCVIKCAARIGIRRKGEYKRKKEKKERKQLQRRPASDKGRCCHDKVASLEASVPMEKKKGEEKKKKLPKDKIYTSCSVGDGEKVQWITLHSITK